EFNLIEMRSSLLLKKICLLTVLVNCLSVYLTHLDCADTEQIMAEKLHNECMGQTAPGKPECALLGNRLSQRAMHEEDEKRSLVTGMKLSSFPQNVDVLKDPEAVTQLGSILKSSARAWKAAGRPFVIQQGRIYLDMLNVSKCPSENMSAALEADGKKFHVFPNSGMGSARDQVHLFCGAVGYVVWAQTDRTVQEHLIEKHMLLPNPVWDCRIRQATSQTIHFVYSTKLCYLSGEVETKQPLVRRMRTVKRETLELISGWVSRSNDPQMVAENFIPPLLGASLVDYQRNVPAAREPAVLSGVAVAVNKLGGHIAAEIPQIFDAVFECTLNMIKKVFLCKYWITEKKNRRDFIFMILQERGQGVLCYVVYIALFCCMEMKINQQGHGNRDMATFVAMSFTVYPKNYLPLFLLICCNNHLDDL
ncbi:UNVERIFIED_CONTAM: hypothetical protein H355_006238, partial [Colinus virginianus]